MIAGVLLSGYIADSLGRRKTLIYGFILNGFCNLISAFSVSFEMLAVLKFFSGFM